MKPISDFSISELLTAYYANEISEPDFILWMQRRGKSMAEIREAMDDK